MTGNLSGINVEKQARALAGSYAPVFERALAAARSRSMTEVLARYI